MIRACEVQSSLDGMEVAFTQDSHLNALLGALSAHNVALRCPTLPRPFLPGHRFPVSLYFALRLRVCSSSSRRARWPACSLLLKREIASGVSVRRRARGTVREGEAGEDAGKVKKTSDDCSIGMTLLAQGSRFEKYINGELTSSLKSVVLFYSCHSFLPVAIFLTFLKIVRIKEYYYLQ